MVFSITSRGLYSDECFVEEKKIIHACEYRKILNNNPFHKSRTTDWTLKKVIYRYVPTGMFKLNTPHVSIIIHTTVRSPSGSH